MKYLNRIGSVILLMLLSLMAQSQTSLSFFPWSKHPAHIAELESLIANANKWALKPNDYELSNLLTSNNNNVKQNTKDSLIQMVAIHFFSDLTYGSQSPNINYLSVTIKKDKEKVNQEIHEFLNNYSLQELVYHKMNAIPEVTILVKALEHLSINDKAFQKKKSILFQTINNYRWLSAMRQEHDVIVVNIPSALLHVFDGTGNPINMKMIVGKKATPTNTLTSFVHQIIVNPYWNVPTSIATKELLPNIQKNPSYIETAHLQVLNQQYRIINPHQIDWSQYSANHFPFYLRQSTGCDNSLGVVKLDFESPFGIYLHDTPEKTLFKNEQRFYSHGCMRMEKPLEVAKWVMRYDSKSLDTIDFAKCYKNPAPIRFVVKQPVVIVVWYNLIDFDETHHWQFYKDIYNRYTY